MATNDSARTAIAERDAAAPGTAQLDIRSSIDAMRPEFGRVIGNTIGAERFVRVALTELRHNPTLAQCTEASILGALMTSAQLNLEPGRALGEAWLVPFFNKDIGQHECTFIVGYKGLAKLARQSGQISSLGTGTLCANDELLEYEEGIEPTLRYRKALSGDRGAAYAWWAAAANVNGGKDLVVLSRADVERVRLRSKAKDSGPWKTDYDAMACKTALRQLAKLLPLSVQFGQAVSLDETVRNVSVADPASSRDLPMLEPVADDGVPL